MGKTQQRARKKAAANTQAPFQKKSVKQAVKKAGEKLTAAFKKNDWAKAVEALAEMRKAGLPPTAVLCNKVLACLCKHQQLDRAIEYLDQMRGQGDATGLCAGVRPSPVTYAIVIKACGQAGHLERALALLADMRADGVEPDTVCWNIAISACAGNAGTAHARALALLRQAEQARRADVVTYNAALGVLQKAAQEASEAQKRVAEARALLQALLSGSGSIQPNDVSFATVIAACAAARDSKAALQVLDAMRGSAVAVTTRACNAALSACERQGRWEAALTLLARMEADGPPPDEVSVRSVVFACCSAKPGPPRLAEAKALFKRVESGGFPGVPSTAVTYNVLVRACDVDVVGSAASQVAMLEGFLRPEDVEGPKGAADTVTGPGGLETMQGLQQPVMHTDDFEAPLFEWPVASRQGSTERPGPREELRQHVSIVAHEKGFQRRPRNRFDLNVWSLDPAAFKHVAERPPVCRHDVPHVTGAFVITGVLAPAECDLIVCVAETMGFAPDEPLTRGSGAIGGGEARIDGCVWLAHEAILGPMFARCLPHLPGVVEGGTPAGINARWRLFRYSEQAVYRPHVDGSWPGSGLVDGKLQYDAFGDRWSQMTFLVYLNDDFEGGSTTFFTSDGHGALQARRVKPQKGAVLLFPHGIHNTQSPVHEGSKVANGVKYVIRSDLLYYKK